MWNEMETEVEMQKERAKGPCESGMAVGRRCGGS